MDWNELLQDMDTSDWVVIITALISALVAIVSGILNHRFTKKMTQRQIDANLKAKARIEWIQKVRDNSAELLKGYFSIINSKNDEDHRRPLNEVKLRSELLALCFGDRSEHIDTKTVEDRNKRLNELDEPLRSTKNNDGKNALMVEYLDLLFDKFFNDYFDVLGTRRGLLTEEYDNACEEVMDFYDDNEDEEDRVDETEKRLTECINKEEDLKMRLYRLRLYISIYLKIEWDIAKEGK